MSIKIPFALLMFPAFQQALEKLAGLRALPNLTSYNIAKILKAVSDETEIVQAAYNKLADNYCAKDADGVPIPHPGGKIGSFKLQDGKADEYGEKVRELGNEEVTIDRPKLKLEQLIKDLTPRDITVLDPLWEPVEEARLKG